MWTKLIRRRASKVDPLALPLQKEHVRNLGISAVNAQLGESGLTHIDAMNQTGSSKWPLSMSRIAYLYNYNCIIRLLIQYRTCVIVFSQRGMLRAWCRCATGDDWLAIRPRNSRETGSWSNSFEMAYPFFHQLCFFPSTLTTCTQILTPPPQWMVALTHLPIHQPHHTHAHTHRRRKKKNTMLSKTSSNG